MTPRDESESGGSQTLERGLALLVELGRHTGGLTTSQVAAATGFHRSIAHRLLVSLHRTGFAARDDDGRYTVGPAVAGLLGGTGPSLRTVAEPVLHRLARRLDATASLVEAVGTAAVTTVVAEPPTDGPLFWYRKGSRDPLDRGAGGLAALASGPPRAAEPDRVRAVREAGYVITHSEVNVGAHGIAAPLPGWPVRAAINVVTADPRLADKAVPHVLAAAAEVGAPGDHLGAE
ncbi:IclR family transcriptional regulator [Streptomyces sp. NPDC087866]|uniref:IclR family transcriptional regulator n=1 Tax=unclassified Streptomyces TaxID=2593676 RepID=UPI0022551CC5|nr:helix-turn-helix domain-containing protein [Streptomyces sp. NBC_01789]MCX4450505.1 helix-turn-helix domain-containing protein [Streptomyces sp. NBC_01789]